MGGIYVSQKVGVVPASGNTGDRAVSVAELTAAQYNGAMVDDTGTAFTISAAEANIAAGSGVTAAEYNELDASVAAVYSEGSAHIPRMLQATYDFAVDGGTIGTIPLGAAIPSNCIILGGIIDVQTTLTSADDSGTGALQCMAANDIVAAVAISNGANPWDQGLHAIKPLWTAATAIKTTSAGSIGFVIGTQNLTAGKFTLTLFYVPTLVNV